MTRLISFALILCFAAGCGDSESGHFKEPGASGAETENRNVPFVEWVDYFADNGLGNAVAVVQKPAGEHHQGVTYVSYQGPLEDPYVAAYDHETGQWTGPYKAGVSEMGKDPSRPKIDNHGKPTLIIDNEGYIHIFFGGHGGMPRHGDNLLGNHHYGRNKHVVSKNPLDISSWEELDTIPPFGTYNQVVKMDNGDLYLFYRHGAHRSDWVYQKSTDNGRSFTAPVTFLKHQRRNDLAAEDSWYAWAGKGQGPDEIFFSFDYHLCWDGDSGRNGMGHTTERRNVFYMTWNTKSDTWRNIHGERLDMPMVREHALEKTLVADTGDEWTFNGSSHLDSMGYPHIGINIGPHMDLHFGGPKQTSHFRWTGEEWVGVRSGGMPVARGDFIVSTPDDVRFLLSYQEASGDGVVAWWTSTDGGKKFTKGKELLRLKNAGLATSAIIRNAHPDAQVIVAEKPQGTDRRRMYLLGESGPVQRNSAQARILDW